MAETRKYPSQVVADEFAASLANRTSPLLSAREVKTPVNGISGKNLTAINRLILGGRQSDPRWFTENQAKSLGYYLKPEAEGRQVVFWEQYQRLKMHDPKTGQPVLDENGQQKYSYKKHERPFMKLYTVYHASQLELENGQPIPAYQLPEPKVDPVGQLENIVKATGATIVHDQKGRSFYRAKDDSIHMPPMSDYQTPEGYYSDLIRELARWTRHEDRLNRPCGPFGTEAFAKEELKVNLAALTIAQSLGMTYQPGQSSQYIKDWQILVKKYPYFLAQSANEAESIKDFVLDFGLSQEATATVEQETAPSNETELSMDTVISESAQMLINAYTQAQLFTTMEDIRTATQGIINSPEFFASGKEIESKIIRSLDTWAGEAADVDNIPNDRIEELTFKVIIAAHLHARHAGNQELSEICQKAIGLYFDAFPDMDPNFDRIIGKEVPADMKWGHDVFTDATYVKEESGRWRVVQPSEITEEAIKQIVPFAVIDENSVMTMDGVMKAFSLEMAIPELTNGRAADQTPADTIFQNRREAETPTDAHHTPGTKAIFAIGDRAANANSLEDIQQVVEQNYRDTVWFLTGDPGVSYTPEEATIARQIQETSKRHLETEKTAGNDIRWLRMNTFVLAAVNSLAKRLHSQESALGTHLQNGEQARRFEDALEKAVAYSGFDQSSLEILKGTAATSRLDAIEQYEPRENSFEAIKKLQWCDVGVLSGRASTWLCRDSEDSSWRLPSDQEAVDMERLSNQVKKNTGRSMALAVGMIPNRLIGGELMTLDGQTRGVVRTADLGKLQGLANPIDAAIPGELLKASVLKILQSENELEHFRQALENVRLLTSEGHVKKLSGEEEMKTEGVLIKKINSLTAGTARDADLPHLRMSTAVVGLAFANMYNLRDLREVCRDSLNGLAQQYPSIAKYVHQALDTEVEAGISRASNSDVLFGMNILRDGALFCLKAGESEWRKMNTAELENLALNIDPLPIFLLDETRCLTCDGRVRTPEMIEALISTQGMDNNEAANDGRESPASPVRRGKPEINPLTPEQELALVCERSGLVLSGPPIMDGKKHRIPVVGGKKGALDGEYCAHDDGRPNGWVKNYKTDEYQKWIYTGHDLSPEQRAELKQSIEASKKERREEMKELREEARRQIRQKCFFADQAPDQTPYLMEKGIKGFGALIDNSRPDTLIVPAYDILAANLSPASPNLQFHDNIQTLQSIAPDGQKQFAKDCPLKGAMNIIDPTGTLTREKPHGPILPVEANREILVAEGYATAATLHMATGKPVAVSFTAANLEPVAKNLKKVFLNIDITICADNDHRQKKNVGIEKAELAAKAVGGQVIVPEFTEAEKAQGLTDFNDLAKSRGLEAVTKIITAELGRSKPTAQSQSPNTGISR